MNPGFGGHPFLGRPPPGPKPGLREDRYYPTRLDDGPKKKNVGWGLNFCREGWVVRELD